MIEQGTDYQTIERINVIVSHIQEVLDEEVVLAASPTVSKPSFPKIKSKSSVEYKNAHIGVYCKPKSSCCERTHPTGEDSYMYTSNGNLTVIGVADGVGGWSEYQVDPSVISYQLMQNCKNIIVNGSTSDSDDGKEKQMDVEEKNEEIPMPKQVLIDAYTMLFTQRQVEAGSTTACLVTVDNSLRLSYANLGDSGFIVIRPSTGQVVFRSREQQHYFNAPYQLAVIPQRIYQFCDPSLLLTDSPNDAESEANVVQLQDGDVVVLASDGLFDNLFDEEIIKTVQTHYMETTEQDKSTSSYLLSKALVKQAMTKFGTDLENHTPFSFGAEKFLISTGAITPDQFIPRQGKPDDVTCIVCSVSASSPPTSPINVTLETNE